jgi:hypothetical protein
MKVQELKEKEKKKQEEARLRLEWEEREKRRRETEIKDIQVGCPFLLPLMTFSLLWFHLRLEVIVPREGLPFFGQIGATAGFLMVQ